MKDVTERTRIIPALCPACASASIGPTSKVKSSRQIEEEWTCDACDSTWQVVYRFHSWGMSNVSILARSPTEEMLDEPKRTE